MPSSVHKTRGLNQCYGSGSAWIKLNMKEQINKNVISLWILDFVYCRTVVWNRKWQIVDRFFFMIEFKVVIYIFQIYLNNIGWIRIRMDPELWLDPDPELGKFRARSGSGINHWDPQHWFKFFQLISVIFAIFLINVPYLTKQHCPIFCCCTELNISSNT